MRRRMRWIEPPFSFVLCSFILTPCHVCCMYLAALSDNSKAGGGDGGKGDESADKYFDPLQAACKTKYPKLIEIALDAIHHLLGIERYHGYFLISVFDSRFCLFVFQNMVIYMVIRV